MFQQGGDFEFRTLTPKELKIVQDNLWGWTRVFSMADAQCVQCKYPLKPQVSYRIAFIGDVCDICWAMHSALAGRAYWTAAHNEWVNENKRRASRKIQLGDGGDYLSR